MRKARRSTRIYAFLCAAVLGCFFLLHPAIAETAGNELTVGVPTDRCPVFYRDADTGEITGIGVDLMRTAAENAGYSVTFAAISENNLSEALDNGNYDLVMPFGSAINSASGRQSVVSDNLIQTPFTLVTVARNKMSPLNTLKVGMLRSLGGAATTVRELYPGITIVLYDDMAGSVKALRAGEVDALLHNSYVWSYALQKPSYSDLSVQPSTMFSMDFRAGTADTPAGREIIGRLNGGIAALTDTRRQAVTLDYTTRRLYRYDFSDYLHAYGLIIGLSALLIFSVVVILLQRHRSMRLKQEEKMRQLIDRDGLTGLLSLDGFRKRAEELLRENQGLSYVMIYANIRNFKYINDSLGREASDDLLRFMANSLQKALPEKDAVCRLSADRFGILSQAEGEDKVIWHDRHVIDEVRNYYIDRGKENRVQVCGGIYVLTPQDYRQISVDQMRDYARVAEKKIRETRGDGYAFYNPEQWEKGKQIAEVINHLPTAIRSGSIHVWYQPQVKGRNGEIIGAEALCRWDHEKLGWLHPEAFLETLEESGMIYDLDCYVWETVCRDLSRWNAQGYRRSVSVNVSRKDIREDRDIPGHFLNLIRTYGLTPDQIRIEITETAFVENPADLIAATRKLQEYGFAVEMDDFGSGHSSLHMLKEVPVDRIKLDLHFLTEAGDQQKGRTIISHIIQMVNDLGMKMIAEGVETEEQARFLRRQGCEEMQGFWFYRPMSVEEFEQACLRQV